jgi:hypothetical protein
VYTQSWSGTLLHTQLCTLLLRCTVSNPRNKAEMRPLDLGYKLSMIMLILSGTPMATGEFYA